MLICIGRGWARLSRSRRPKGFTSWLTRVEGKCTRFDVLLLTHNDQDHAGRVPAILRSGLIDEVWLPYDWYLLYSAGAA
jgi:hypothetical protein